MNEGKPCIYHWVEANPRVNRLGLFRHLTGMAGPDEISNIFPKFWPIVVFSSPPDCLLGIRMICMVYKVENDISFCSWDQWPRVERIRDLTQKTTSGHVNVFDYDPSRVLTTTMGCYLRTEGLGRLQGSRTDGMEGDFFESCDGQVEGGYYADPEAECQVLPKRKIS